MLPAISKIDFFTTLTGVKYFVIEKTTTITVLKFELFWSL